MCVCVCLTLAHSYTTLIYTVGALHVCLCTVICVISPGRLYFFGNLQYLPNPLICMFLRWTLQQMLWIFFRCALAMMAGNAVQATTEVAKFSASLD